MKNFFRRHKTLIALVLFALGLRAWALGRYADQLMLDPDGYRSLATSLAAGEGFGFPTGRALGNPTAYRPPLYPCLLAAVFWAGGDDEQTVSRLIGALQLVLGLLVAWLTLLMAQRLKLGNFGPLAGLLVAVDPLLVYGTTQVMTETTATFLAALMLWLAIRARSNADWFVVGAAFGLACLCRPTFWAFGAGMIVIEGWRTLTGHEIDRARRAGFALLGAILIIAPWGVRNLSVMGYPILTTTHGGYTLLLGHNPVYTREVVDRAWNAPWEGASQVSWAAELEAELKSEFEAKDYDEPAPSETFRDRWMNRKAIAYMREEPFTAVRAGISLVVRFWNVVPLQTETRRIGAPLRWAIGLFYAATLLAMLAGVWKLRPGAWITWTPLVVLIVSFTAVHFFYWADMRMRAPLIPAIALLAAHGVRTLMRPA